MQHLHFGQTGVGRIERQGKHGGEGYTISGEMTSMWERILMGQEETVNLGGNIEKEITGLKVRAEEERKESRVTPNW